MVSVRIPVMWRKDGQVLIPAEITSAILREIADQLADWPEQGADPGTVHGLQVLLGRVADQIDLDCIAVVTELEQSDAS